ALAYAAPPVIGTTVPLSGATLTAKPSSLVVNVTDVTALKPAPLGGTIKLNGTNVTGVMVSQSPKKIYAYPPAGLYVNGTNEVTATVTDTANKAATYHWHFTLAVLPTFGTPIPAAGSTVTTRTPAISVPFTLPGGGSASATATVNGAVVTPAVSGGVVTVPSPVLPNDAISTVVVTVTDSQGNKATKTWSFNVEIYAGMSGSTAVCTD
ncbi:MAG: hypothetical protein WCP28_18615, partial [Actinomycetes bacterium]